MGETPYSKSFRKNSDNGRKIYFFKRKGAETQSFFEHGKHERHELLSVQAPEVRYKL